MTPWAAADIDPDHAVAELRRRFPGVCAWLGEFTGSWWAVFRDRSGRHRLLEAPTPQALGRLLDEAGLRRRAPVPHARTGAATRRGTGSRAAPRPVERRGRHAARARRGWGFLAVR
ncbi:hypothetical protein [Actinomadura fibrosa]|uniref:Uncharacterized protein n=1 Tax=Actinomadura fibrosa TaxID=111802 RepID=A0ABW2XIX7_9ACTN|nr:hypothetical protein [Actinomadura fibrosa]